jgi:hypothetical protein
VEERLVALGVVSPSELARPGGTIAVDVERGPSLLRMTITVAESARQRETELVRAATQALREFDRRSPVIDVFVRTPSSV